MTMCEARVQPLVPGTWGYSGTSLSNPLDPNHDPAKPVVAGGGVNIFFVAGGQLGAVDFAQVVGIFVQAVVLLGAASGLVDSLAGSVDAPSFTGRLVRRLMALLDLVCGGASAVCCAALNRVLGGSPAGMQLPHSRMRDELPAAGGAGMVPPGAGASLPLAPTAVSGTALGHAPKQPLSV